MNVKPIHIQLQPEQINEILHITLDEDPDRALAFVQTVLAKKVEKALLNGWEAFPLLSEGQTYYK